VEVEIWWWCGGGRVVEGCSLLKVPKILGPNIKLAGEDRSRIFVKRWLCCASPDQFGKALSSCFHLRQGAVTERHEDKFLVLGSRCNSRVKAALEKLLGHIGFSGRSKNAPRDQERSLVSVARSMPHIQCWKEKNLEIPQLASEVTSCAEALGK
jgi:hypothetical protein